jgi:alpha-N-arabinofuranosidase
MTPKTVLTTAALFIAGTLTSTAAPGRDLFGEYLGVSREAVDAKIDDAFQQLFYGNDKDQRVYYPVGKDMAYIYAANSDDVRSEGMSYGMMIAVQLDKKEEFDRLWKWTKTHMYHAEGPRKGYYSWQCRKDGTQIDPGSASDGEEWFVTALFFASGRWGDGEGIYDYSAEADAILHTMLHKGEEGRTENYPINMFDPETKQIRFVPLDRWAKITDPSYQLPAFYELWALWAAEDNSYWKEAADASRAFFHKAANPKTGLMPEYAHMDGKPFAANGNFSFDAHRIMANVAIDSEWFGKDPWQTTQSERILRFLTPFRPTIPFTISLNGIPHTDGSSESITAMAAVAALAAPREIGEPFVRDLWEKAIPSGPYRYYNSLLYMLGLLQTGGRFNVYAPEGKSDPFAPKETARFNHFDYQGDDAVFQRPLGEDEYRNPILPGYRPDPSFCKVGDTFYLVNSSFAYYPGVPIYKSSDLVHWESLGHVLDRPAQLPLDGVRISEGIFAPTISHHDGTFYMVTTNVSYLGNFYVTAKDPAGPWSDPILLPGVDGIDPSFFFDEATGKAWIVNNGVPPDNNPLYDGHRAIWIQEFDTAKGEPVGPRKIIINGGTDLAKHPVWIEGPHILRHGEWLYLICAEGGTNVEHSQVVFRAKDPLGPWTPWEKNPILTQRDLDPNRPNPVTSSGHADFVDAGDAGWWAVFLACRPYEGDNYITGRETFLLPVTWTDDGWPVILDKGKSIPYVHQRPELPSTAGNFLPSGNFTFADDFASATLKDDWLMVRTPRENWISTGADGLALTPRAPNLASSRQPAYLGYRIQHARCTISLDASVPQDARVDTGLALYQSGTHNYFLGIRRDGRNAEVFLEKRAGGSAETLSRKVLTIAQGQTVRLTANIDGGTCTFLATTGAESVEIAKADASVLTTHAAGGFVGATAGPHARIR